MAEVIQERPGWFSLSGRARRREYWGRTILVWLIIFVVAMPLCLMSVGMSGENSELAGVCFIAGLVISFLAGISLIPLTVRRLHDRNMSGWWILGFFLLGLIPIVGFISGIAQIVIVWFLDGTPGPNRFGPDPKGRG